jgi:KDO2-lipid IV(A) lauroyltransferase
MTVSVPASQRASEHEEIKRIRWAEHALNNGLIFSATYHGVSRIPERLSYGIGKLGTWLAYKTMRRVTSALIANLHEVFPGLSEEQLSSLALLTYRSYAYDTIDFIRSLSQSPDELARKVTDLDRAIFDRLLGEGKGILLVAAHFGSWELGAVIVRKLLGYPLTMVAMAEPSPAVNRIRSDMRTSLGIELLEVRRGIDTPLQIRRQLAENRIVAMLLDRHLGRDHVAVRFCDARAHFLRTPALLSYLTGAPMLPAWVVRDADGRFRCMFDEPVYVPRDGDRDATIAQATQKMAAHLETKIREYPHLWYQFYPFWETQPSDAASEEARAPLKNVRRTP